MQDNILNLFQDICRPYKDNVGGEKLDIIIDWLDARQINNQYLEGIGLIINQQENPRVTLVSHMDLIKKFQKGFANGNYFEALQEEQIVKGALDNTITNACALFSIEKLLENGISDVEILLSEGEEVGCIGMENYLKEFTSKSLQTFFVNLDVTNDGWGTHMSVEYDKPHFKTLKHLQELLSPFDAHLQSDRVGDDIDAVIDAKCAGFSFCLPTKNTIHSYKNYCSIDSIVPYFDALQVLLSNLSKHSSYNTFSSWHFKTALITKSSKKFLKKIEAIKVSRRNNYSNPYKSSFSREFGEYKPIKSSSNKIDIAQKYKNLTAFQIEKRTSFLAQVLDYLTIDKGLVNLIEVGNFLEEVIMKDIDFTSEHFCSDLFLSSDQADLILEDLIDNEILILESDNHFKFPAAEYIEIP